MASSEAVQAAREKVKELEVEAQLLKTRVSETMGAGIRRLVFGRNAHEEQLYQVLARLEEAKKASLLIELEARRAGEKSYRDDWADRNLDNFGNR